MTEESYQERRTRPSGSQVTKHPATWAAAATTPRQVRPWSSGRASTAYPSLSKEPVAITSPHASHASRTMRPRVAG